MSLKHRRDFVGQRVRQLRKQRAMTQSDLAARIGVMQSDLCRMEKGEYRVGLDPLFRILEVFGMNIGEFFDEGTAMQAAGSEAELLGLFRRLPEEARVALIDYARFKGQQADRGRTARSSG